VSNFIEQIIGHARYVRSYLLMSRNASARSHIYSKDSRRFNSVLMHESFVLPMKNRTSSHSNFWYYLYVFSPRDLYNTEREKKTIIICNRFVLPDSLNKCRALRCRHVACVDVQLPSVALRSASARVGFLLQSNLADICPVGGDWLWRCSVDRGQSRRAPLRSFSRRHSPVAKWPILCRVGR